MKPFILIVGPTASGKSALGLKLAQHFHGAVMNCDSIQVYQRLNIGAAKPSLEERALVPHFLFDVLAPGEILTAGDFRKMALEVLEQELPHRPVFGVGGSGFYIQALEKGMFDVPKPRPESEKKVRQLLASTGLASLYENLRIKDPEYAERLSPNDSYRISRALIIMEDSGQTVTELRKQFKPKPFPFSLLKLGLAPDRDFLLPRVEARTTEMLKMGLLQEIQGLIDDGFEAWPPLESVGYKEGLACLKGKVAREDLGRLISEKTMQLSKKQRTWFKRESDTQWLDVENPFPQACELVENFLAGDGFHA